MKYNDLILIGKDTIGKFILQRPNGNIIYDKLFVDNNYESYGSMWSRKCGYVYKINLILEETKHEVIKISKTAIAKLYKDLIEETKNAEIVNNYKEDSDIIKRMESSIEFLTQEIVNTKKKAIDEDSEDITVKWENKAKSIRQKEKAIKHIKSKLTGIKQRYDEEQAKLIRRKNEDIEMLTKNRDCILEYIKAEEI